jgi:hypothetical protein
VTMASPSITSEQAMQPPPLPLAEDNGDDGDHEPRNHRTIDQLTRDHANKMLAVYDCYDREIREAYRRMT